jgi:hypothetical protein
LSKYNLRMKKINLLITSFLLVSIITFIGCKKEEVKKDVVIETVIAEFSVSKTTGFVATDTFKLMNSSSPVSGSTFEWTVTPSEGVLYVNNTSNTSIHPNLIFQNQGTYTVNLKTTHKDGMDDTTVVGLLTVIPEGFLASSVPSNRVAVLEDFTGVRCGYCPDGHVRAKAIEVANPGKFIVIAVHGGSFAAPQAGWANLTTAYGQSLITQAKVSGYPAGSVSRILCSELGVAPQMSGGSAMSRSSWATAASKVMAMSAPVNLGANITFDEATRKLTIKVDLFYTAEQTSENRLNVALLQDHIFTKQSGGTPNSNSYEQNHVLRDLITGQWGVEITETKTKGAIVSKVFTYTVPADYNGATLPPGGGSVVVKDLKIVAFVTKGKTDILNAIQLPVIK